MSKKITTIIPIYNALSNVKSLLKTLIKYYNFEIGKIILINDFSSPQTEKFLKSFTKKYPDFELINNEENLGFVKTCNKGIHIADTEIVVLLNSDTEIPHLFCEKILECFKSDSNIGLASPISSNSNAYYIPKRISFSIEKMNKIIESKHQPSYPRICEAEGFCFCARKKVLDELDGLDEIYGKGYHEEVDLSYRAITKGWKIALIDNLYVYHQGKASFGTQNCNVLKEQNNPIFYSRWKGFRDNHKKEYNLVNPCIAIEKEVFGKQIKLKTFSFKNYISKIF